MILKLSELDARFIVRDPTAGDSGGWRDVGTSVIGIGAVEPDGVWFLCPKCFRENSGPIGTHMVICWFVGRVTDDVTPKPGRWNPVGTDIDNLTFVGPGATSVHIQGGCGAHFHVTNGTIDGA